MKRKMIKAVAKPEVPQKPEPNPVTKVAIDAAIEAWKERPVRASVKVECEDDAAMHVEAPHTHELGNHAMLLDAFGTGSSNFLNTSLVELEWMTRSRGAGMAKDPVRLNSALALVASVGAQDELEAALAMQMAGCHTLGVEMLARARQADRNDDMEILVNLAVKLQRTFAAQVEALARLRGDANQSVRVEHVHVHSGAQAIVGNANTGGGGRGRGKKRGQSDATQDFSGQPALRSPDPEGDSVSVPSGVGEAQMSDARGYKSRRAARQ